MNKDIAFIVVAVSCLACFPACFPESDSGTVSSSGASRMVTRVDTNSQGHTAEQMSVADKLKRENVIGGIQYVYGLSPYSGEIIMQSVAKGKVSSSGKRLSPKTVAALDGQYVGSMHSGIPVNIGGSTYFTSEVLGDDGTYGDSCEYLYWTDVNDVFHRQYLNGGLIIHVSDQPMRFGNVTMTVETPTK